MGHLARNWVHTFEKHPDLLEYQIFSRAYPWLTPLRWRGPHVVDGPEDMAVDHPTFWKWIETFRPDVILFQDQNLHGPSKMRHESERLRRQGIRLINYPDWIKRGDMEQYRGLYDANLSHVKRNHQWLIEAGVESPTYIPWGVVTGNFPFIERGREPVVRFYINLGTGTARKGYPVLPRAIRRMEGGHLSRFFGGRRRREFSFIATAVESSTRALKRSFVSFFNRHPKCELRFQTADNSQGGLFRLGDVYVYPTLKEGVGLTITEALCTGMPVVTTDYPTMNEWLRDGVEGRLIRPKRIRKSSMPMDKVHVDVGHLAEIMRSYVERPQQIIDQSHEARRTVETHYNWDDRDEPVLALLKG